MSGKIAKEKIILGIDPGTTVMGYGIIRISGKQIALVTMGVVKLQKLDDYGLKLKRIFEKTLFLIDEYLPDEIALEAPFYGKNVQSMLKLGRAQGVSMAAALYRGLPITEYSPRKIKQAVTGSGAASKEQVADMLQRTIGYKQQASMLDATDGLAVAICHHYQSSVSLGGAKNGGWEKFIRENPDKVR